MKHPQTLQMVCLVVVKIKSQREDCLPQTWRLELGNSKMYKNDTNTGQGEMHVYKAQNNRLIDF